jgi:hydrogenase-4 component E
VVTVPALLVLVVLANVSLYFTGRLRVHVRILAAQGLLLGLMPLVIRGTWPDARLAALAALTIAVKAAALPWLLHRTILRTGVGVETGQRVRHVTASIVGVGLLGLGSWLADRLPLAVDGEARRCLAVAFFTVFSGLFLCVARSRLLSQVIGVLVLENGVLLAGLAVPQEVPVMVELGVLLDVTVAAFVMVVIIHHVKREVPSLDATRLAELRD